MTYYYYTPSSSDLQHYGVLGMHWGIRRYQPYSTTGPRKGGKTGREIGEAANSKSNKTSNKSGLTEGQKKALKYAAIGLGVAAAAGVGYLAWQKYGRQYVDITLKSGRMLQTLSDEADRLKMGDNFYAAINKRDKSIYKGLYGGAGGKKNIESRVVGKLKIASPNNAGKVFNSVFNKNEDFRKQVETLAREYLNAGLRPDYNEGYADILSGKMSKKAYDAFNLMLVGHGEYFDTPKKTFFDALKQAGYAGLLDVNDRSYSGFNAKAPVIIIDKTKVLTKSITDLSYQEVLKNFDEVQKMFKNDEIIKDLIKQASVSSAAGSAAVGATWLEAILKDQDKKSA